MIATSGSGARQTYSLQPQIFFAPSLSSISSTSAVNESVVNVGAAHVNDVSSPVAVISFPTTQHGTLAPKMATKNVTLEAMGNRGVYSLVAGNLTVPTAAMGQVSVDVVGFVDGGEVTDEYNLVPQI